MCKFLSPCVPELKIKDYATYRAFCCGLCSRLQEEYGFCARYMQMWDVVVFALLDDGLAGRDGTVCRGRCLRHPLHKKEMLCHTHGISLAAELNVLMDWYLLSTMRPTVSVWLKKQLMSEAYHKAAAKARVLDRIMIQERDHALALEQASCSSYEASCEPVANFFSALFAYCAPDSSTVKALRRAGFAVGKIVHLLNELENYREDQRYGRYNIFLQNGLDYAAAQENARHQCNQAAAELAHAYNLLDIKRNRPLLENILFQGLEETVTNVGTAKVHKWCKV